MGWDGISCLGDQDRDLHMHSYVRGVGWDGRILHYAYVGHNMAFEDHYLMSGRGFLHTYIHIHGDIPGSR